MELVGTSTTMGGAKVMSEVMSLELRLVHGEERRPQISISHPDMDTHWSL